MVGRDSKRQRLCDEEERNGGRGWILAVRGYGATRWWCSVMARQDRVLEPVPVFGAGRCGCAFIQWRRGQRSVLWAVARRWDLERRAARGPAGSSGSGAIPDPLSPAILSRQGLGSGHLRQPPRSAQPSANASQLQPAARESPVKASGCLRLPPSPRPVPSSLLCNKWCSAFRRRLACIPKISPYPPMLLSAQVVTPLLTHKRTWSADHACLSPSPTSAISNVSTLPAPSECHWTLHGASCLLVPEQMRLTQDGIVGINAEFALAV